MQIFRNAYVFAAVVLGLLVAVAWTKRESLQRAAPGSPAPDFEAYTLDGALVSLDDYQDRVILLNIWATWCPPCREEMPSMERLYRRFRDEGAPFDILAVSIDAELGETNESGNVGGDLRAFAAEYGLTFTILHDPSGEIQRTYWTSGVPESFLIDKEGIIRRRLAGATEWDSPANQAAVRRLLEE